MTSPVPYSEIVAAQAIAETFLKTTKLAIDWEHTWIDRHPEYYRDQSHMDLVKANVTKRHIEALGLRLRLYIVNVVREKTLEAFRNTSLETVRDNAQFGNSMKSQSRHPTIQVPPHKGPRE